MRRRRRPGHDHRFRRRRARGGGPSPTRCRCEPPPTVRVRAIATSKAPVPPGSRSAPRSLRHVDLAVGREGDGPVRTAGEGSDARGEHPRRHPGRHATRSPAPVTGSRRASAASDPSASRRTSLPRIDVGGDRDRRPSVHGRGDEEHPGSAFPGVEPQPDSQASRAPSGDAARAMAGPSEILLPAEIGGPSAGAGEEEEHRGGEVVRGSHAIHSWRSRRARSA